MRIEKQIQIQNAERQIKWVREYASNGDAFQQKKAMKSLLEVIVALSEHVDAMQLEINDLKNRTQTIENSND
jgi:hypothetical protein